MQTVATNDVLSDDLNAVRTQIQQQLSSNVPLVNELSGHILQRGGKLIRPQILMLAALASDYTGKQHIDLATVIEFVHTATLLHDDVVDHSEMRRGQQAANTIWGNEASVLVGDFLYSRAFQIMTACQNLKVLEVMASATNTIVEAEVLQLAHKHNPETDEETYMQIIIGKTAMLFAASAHVGAILADNPQHQAFADFGLHYGIAFQLIDDSLDYCSDSETLGKNVGDDLAEGKPTLPLIFTLQHCTPAEKSLIIESIEEGSLAHINEIKQAIDNSKAIEYIHNKAQHHIQLAKEQLSDVADSPYKDALIHLADAAIARTY